MNSLVSLPIAAAMPIAAPSIRATPPRDATTSPVLAAIEAHKAARASFIAACDRHLEIDRTRIGLSKNPSERRIWEYSEKEMSRAHDIEDQAACDLLDVMPTSIEELVALVAYAHEADTDGEGWPQDLCESDNKSRTWQFFLIRNLAKALPDLAART